MISTPEILCRLRIAVWVAGRGLRVRHCLRRISAPLSGQAQTDSNGRAQPASRCGLHH